MKSRVTIPVSVCLAALAAGCSTGQPVQNFVDEPVSAVLDGSARSAEEVRAAIVKGCQARLWRAVEVGESEVKCNILVRGKHYAEVRIPYTGNTYSILYSDSRVLDYDPRKERIHRNYNKWVILLSQSIQRQFDSQ